MRIFGTYSGDFVFSQGEIYIGILNEEIHAEVSYTSIGAMHEKVKIKNITDSYLELILNLNNVDHSVQLQYKDDELTGVIDLIDTKINVSFSKIKNSFEFSEPYSVIPKQHIEILKENNSYNEKPISIHFDYELNNKNVLDYLNEVGIKTQNNNDLATIESLLNKFCSKIHQDGVNYTLSDGYGTINQLKFALEQNSFTNCRGMAIIFSGILRAYGFKSSYITCMPYDTEDLEAHVVCEVYVEELKKFIFIDPSTQVYFIKDGVILNLLELRKCIENNESVSFYKVSSDNDETFDLISYLGYLSKNIFYFIKCIDNCEDKESNGENLFCFIPEEYADVVNDKYKYISSNINEYYQH